MKTWLNFRIFSRLSIFFLGVISGPVNAAMYVYPMEASLGESGASQIRVISQDNDVQFVMVKLKKIVNPGTNKENEIDSDMSDAAQLIVTPQKIALAAGGERVVRLVSVNLPQKETTWRVYFEGVNEAAYNSTSGPEGSAPGNAQVGVNIIWGGACSRGATESSFQHGVQPCFRKSDKHGNRSYPRKGDRNVSFSQRLHVGKKELTLYPETELAIPGVTFEPGNLYKIKYFNWIKNTEEVMELPVLQANKRLSK
ncbi:fimbrial protein [Erwinia aphidicola]|nr:fimbrial protein [Erwinia aphidicola]